MNLRAGAPADQFVFLFPHRETPRPRARSDHPPGCGTAGRDRRAGQPALAAPRPRFHAFDNGAPIHLVKATLGDRSVATTSAYIHARLERL